ncbi:MAG: PepSY-like domain-containing protein [Bacteroidota bacterium]
MKKILLLIVVLLTSFNFSFAQEKKIKAALVPESVLNGYKEKLKKAEVNNWYQDGDMYLASYDKGENTYKATFNADGKWIKTTTKIKESQVSASIKKAIKNTEWKDWKMSECYKVETPEYKKLYELHMKKSKEVKVLSFDPAGKALDIK